MILQQIQTNYEQTSTSELASTAELVLAARDGDRQAFGRLAIRYERAVYAAVYRRLGNHAETQEPCQDVLIQAMRKIGQLRDPSRFGGWLRSIASRMALNRAMRRKPLIASEADTVEAASVETETPVGVVLSRERQSQVHSGLGRLRAMDRDTLVAFYFDGRSLIEMSESFDSPVGTIKRRLHTARKRLAKELEALATV